MHRPIVTLVSINVQSFWLNTLFRFIGILPLGLLRACGAGVGHLMWWRNGREAQVTKRNIELCFPQLSQTGQDELAQRSLVNTAQTGLELIKVWMQSNQHTAAQIRSVENQELFDNALLSGKGLLLLVPHLGNWEVVGLWCGQRREMTALYQPPKQALLEPMIKQARERMGNRLHPTDVTGVRAVLKALKNDGVSAILPDQEPDPEGGRFAPFFGVETLTMTLIHGLAKRTGCVVLMAYGQRVAGGWQIVFKEADPAIAASDIDESVRALNRSVESCVQDCPEQYQWEYKRFKKRPPGETKVY
jgi:KDO2-lipid IV(A) lauroyltransferase